MSVDEYQYRVIGIEQPTVASPQVKEVKVIKKRSLVPGGTRSANVGDFDIKANEIVHLKLNNGFSLWLRADDLLDEFGKPNISRGSQHTWEIRVDPAKFQANRSARGLAGLAIKVLDFFDVDLQSYTASKLCSLWEDKLLEKKAANLYRCSLEDTYALSEKGELKYEQPLLLFIHGTASNSQKSFGGLWEASSKVGKAARERLKKKYGEAVYAFEHRTLTESPIQNALQLVKQLPNNAKLHLITYSRGGLVGELLCLGDLKSTLPDTETIHNLFAADRTIALQLGLNPLDESAQKERNKAYDDDREALQTLLKELKQRQIKVERFVRVACPASGTTLASGRLDRWLSALNYLSGDGLFGDTVDFLLAVLKERTDPRTLPGLEAMMPGSALTRLLQDPSLETNADLSIIAGDIEGDSVWSQLKLWVTDWFYGSDHDLVVNTGSMYGGLRRLPQQARFLCDRGPAVHHFNYFNNDKTINWLLQGLERLDGSNGPFQAIEQAKPEQPRWRSAVQRSRSSATPRPLAVVLPGTMGSTLKVGKEEVWLNYWTLAQGGLKKIQMGAIGVQPDDLLDDFYGPLLEFLALTHRVEIVPYDWRLSIREAAKRLIETLQEHLPEAERNYQPVHLIAHSMGGLVVRAMLADGKEGTALWQRIVKLPKSRFLMLGTPNQGSYEAVRWLTGNNATQAKLSLLDLTQNTDEIANLVRRYPGLLELLPFDPDSKDFTQSNLWADLKAQLSAAWLPPETLDLVNIRDTWSLLKNPAQSVDPKYTCYVAGCQDATVVDYRLVDCGGWLHANSNCKRFEFLATREGDGTVSWKSGRLPDVPLWYLEDTAHDDLCRQKRAFPGYLDLLMNGDTSHLSKTPPGRARAPVGEPELFALPAYPVIDSIPSEASLRNFGFGSSRPMREMESGLTIPIIEVSICHGNLAYAKHPVLVGHYRGDGIFSAEKALDERLECQLSTRIRLGLYPGAIGSHALFYAKEPNAKPSGAIVIGLGQVGDLTPGLLTLGVQNALLECALQIAQWPAEDTRFSTEAGKRSIDITSMLVGTGAGGMTVRDSIEAILRGAIAANEKLAEAELVDQVAINRLEFLELYEDIAIAAAEALNLILANNQLSNHVNWPDATVRAGEGGYTRLRYDEMGGWWHRMEISETEGREMLRFVSTTDRARAEETLATGQLKLADNFIRQASQDAGANSEAAKTLFEMLLPNRLKELAPQQEGLVLIVDESSARYPWELLENRWSHNGKPPAVSAGLIRQLKTSVFRPSPVHTTKLNALVIGNPNLSGWSSFPDLVGAREEAQKVSELFNGNGFQAIDYIDANADDILSGLHKDEWRVLHLAGHGVHDFDVSKADSSALDLLDNATQSVYSKKKLISGMVIGKNTFLTPGDIEQMRWVPELVFINCCYLGKTQSVIEKPYGALAANLAAQFIVMGVKAVVSAGWAINDQAGLAFADSFYQKMLLGMSFGDAVRLAREENWNNFKTLNTWGAYQCYGDPDYRLMNKGTDLLAPSTKKKTYYAPAELLTDLKNDTAFIRMQLNDKRKTEAELSDLKQMIDGRLTAIPQDKQKAWLAREDVKIAFGLAYGELRAWDEAIQYLEAALQAGNAECSIKVMEQLTNFRVRAASQRWSQVDAVTDAKAQHQCRTDIEKAIKELELLCEFFPTSERYSIMGSAYKRLARMQTNKKSLQNALEKMALYYRKAYEKSGSTDYYPFTNMVTANWLIKNLGKPSGNDFDALINDCDRIIEITQEKNSRSPNFWNSVALADCALIKWMLRGELSEASTNEVITLYQRAIQRGASPREIGSVKENFQFLMDLTQSLAQPIHEAINTVFESLP
ncbi:MAG TPA: CHAT domain-containing protein [Nitrosomonas sp.]|nr:CHAT domain-containing protein [Nitrosomonas sp.]